MKTPIEVATEDVHEERDVPIHHVQTLIEYHRKNGWNLVGVVAEPKNPNCVIMWLVKHEPITVNMTGKALADSNG